MPSPALGHWLSSSQPAAAAMDQSPPATLLDFSVPLTAVMDSWEQRKNRFLKSWGPADSREDLLNSQCFLVSQERPRPPPPTGRSQSTDWHSDKILACSYIGAILNASDRHKPSNSRLFKFGPSNFRSKITTISPESLRFHTASSRYYGLDLIFSNFTNYDETGTEWNSFVWIQISQHSDRRNVS